MNLSVVFVVITSIICRKSPNYISPPLPTRVTLQFCPNTLANSSHIDLSSTQCPGLYITRIIGDPNVFVNNNSLG